MEPQVHKTLKFTPDQAELIVGGTKTVTYRLWDEKNITEGDILTFVKKPSMEVFAQAKVISAEEKPYGEFDKSQIETSDLQYYNRNIDQNTPVKIIKFEILGNRS